MAADVSFISLRLILQALRRLLRPWEGFGTEALVLVKPQFEVGKERVGKGGVVRDPAAHRDAITTVISAAASWAATPGAGGVSHHRSGREP